MKTFMLASLLTVGLAACTPEVPETTDSAPITDPAAGGTTELEQTQTSPTMADEQTIVDLASANPQFSTLVDLIIQADLADTLSAEGPFTVFAPTNQAFEDVPEETMAALADDPELLAQVLQYHVVSGEVTSEQVVTLESAETLEGGSLDISVDEGRVMINNANVTSTDLTASNGVIHVIDTVLIPED